jgi:hypothetical protein
MGYESKLYIVEKSCLRDDDGMVYAEVIASFDMCKCYFLSGVLTKEPQTNCYFYADDGNTKVLEDMYGDALTETSVDTVINILEEAIEMGEEYRRIFPLLSMLKTFKEQQAENKWINLVVLHYGY